MPLNYVPETWEDEELADVALYDILDSEDAPINEDVKINLATDVVVAGTGVTAERMNHIEQGIADASDLVDRMTVPATALTIVANEITITQDNHYLASGSSGDIETISGMEAGQEVKLYMEDFGVDSVTFKHGVDNISCAGGADVDFSNGAIFLTSDGVTVFVSGGGGGGVVGIADGGTGQTTAGAAFDALTVEGANIAAAATTNIGAGTGVIITITGNTTITAFDNVAAGRIRVLKFTGTPLLTHNATTLKLPGSANYQVVAGDVFVFESEGSGNWKCIGYTLVSGRAIVGGGMSNSIASVTTSNVNGVSGTRHVLNLAGLTANRNFVLLAGAVGDEIEVNISAGDDTYALIIIGNTGISINGGATATEWSRLFITGETVRFVATSTSNWQVVMDGRIPCIAIIERQAAQSINNTTATKIAFDTVNTNRGDMGDITTNDRVNIRRANTYVVSGYVSIANVLDDQEQLEAELYRNGSIYKFKRDFVSSALSERYAAAEVIHRGSLAINDYLELYLWHNEGAAQNTDTTYYPTLTVIEQL